MFGNAKAGIIFGHKDVTVPFLTDGATVGISSNLDKVVNAIGKANGIEFKLVRYKNAKSTTLGVLNKEVQFGMSNGAKRFWKNTKTKWSLFSLMVTLSKEYVLKTIGVDPIPTFDVYIHFGPNS